MNATRQLHDLGQSLWLDNITRELLTSGTLARYIAEYSVTGLTSNPTISIRRSKTGASMTTPSMRKPPRASRARPRSSNWRWRI